MLPDWLSRRLLRFEREIEESVASFAAALPPGASVLDCGAGESRHRRHFGRHRYVAVDLGVGDAAWDYSKLDVAGDLTSLPFRDASFDAALSIVTLEHVADPARAVTEMSRVLRSGGLALFAVPMEWEVHQAPHDYFRYTRYGLHSLLTRAGMEVIEMTASGGLFTLAGRRLLEIGKVSIVVGLLLSPVALLLLSLDGLDHRRDHTVGYLCRARKKA